MGRIIQFALMAVIAMGLGMVATPSDGMAEKRNPYTGDAEKIREGKQLFFLFGCNGCHGKGGGGMGPPINDDEWQYSSEDETLFKLIKGQIPGQIMPIFADAIKEDEVWPLLSFVRTLYHGDPSKVNW